MNRLTTCLTAVLLAANLANLGCADNVKKELAQVKSDYNQLNVKHQELQKDLAGSEAKNIDLETQLNSKSAELAAVNSELASLKANVGKMSPALPQPRKAAMRATLAADVLFNAGRATLSKPGAARLRGIVAKIKAQHPNATVHVYGYTDSDRIERSAKLWKDNLDLSANRAMAVSRQLWVLGIAPEKIKTIAMGATNFVASNKTAAGKAKNRRVEIAVTEP